MTVGSGVLVPRLRYAAGTAPLGPPILPLGALESAVLEALAGKGPLIKRSFRPPNDETQMAYFNEPFTPNEAFFVRCDLANLPEVNTNGWTLRISAEAVQPPLELTLAQITRRGSRRPVKYGGGSGSIGDP